MALLGAGLAATKLKVDTNPALMIDGDLPFRQNYNDLITQFPELDNGFVIVIDAAEATAGRKVAVDVARQLEARPDLFADVFAPGTGEYFNRYGVLYLDEAAVKQIADEIRDVDAADQYPVAAARSLRCRQPVPADGAGGGDRAGAP